MSTLRQIIDLSVQMDEAVPCWWPGVPPLAAR
jgi:hypothetical protein